MPTNTTKLNLVKPLKSEKYNVDVFNGNADIIDSQIYSKTEVDTALNDKAPLVHTHPISEVVNLQTALNGKADTTTTINNQPLSSNITINASGVPNTPAGNISATNVQNALNELDTEKVDKLMATNLVTNGDFSNGTTGWIGVGSTLSALSNTLSVIGFGDSIQPRVQADSTSPIVVGNRYYIRTRARVTNSVSTQIQVLLQGTISGSVVSEFVLNPIQNQWYQFSNIITQTTQTGNFRVTVGHTYVDSATALNKVMEVQYAVAINLTTTFGAGNEPTKEQMDKLLSVYPNSWFNGTSEIGSIGALMRASLGGQVVTPTLLNSRTGTAQYVFSNDGLVIFRGTASGGSLNTNIFVLPENIRPIATRVFPISANSAFGVITVAANGEVRQTVGALTNVFLDGIVFKVGV